MAKPKFIETETEAAYRRGCHQTAFEISNDITAATTLDEAKELAEEWFRTLAKMRYVGKELHGYLWIAGAAVDERNARRVARRPPCP